MLDSLIRKLYSLEPLKAIFARVKLGFHIAGLSVQYDDGTDLKDPETILEKMLAEMEKHEKNF